MKNSFTLFFLLAATLNLIAKEKEKPVKSNIKEVTVFLKGASITSVGSSSLIIGTNDLVFEDLSPDIDPNSIQAKGEGNFTILAVTFRNNYLNNQPKTKDIQALEDSLEALQTKIKLQQNIRFVYESEESFLLSNKSIGGANTGVNAVDLEKIASILRSRLTEIKTKTLESNLKEKKLNEEITKLSNQLREQNAKRNKNTGEIIVTVAAKSPGNAKITLTYNVYNAGWSPVYDIRAINSSSPVNLDFRANVYQNTGFDWENVKLILSTGNPSLSGTVPVLKPWRLNFYNPNRYRQNVSSKESAGAMPRSQPSQAIQSSKAESMDEEAYEKKADYSSNYTEVSESQTNILYEINIPYNIASDSKPHSVGIQTYDLPATYRYFCAPKLDKDAFLLAKITGWDKYNLISGETNVFFEGTFVGKSYLNTIATTDTLDISLGRDKSVVVIRNILNDYSENSIIGTNKKETKGFEIAVRNKKKQEIEINIEDQIPLSTNGEIEVGLVESSGGIYDKDTGKITWKLKLPAADTKKLKMSYYVKYPKDKVISNL